MAAYPRGTLYSGLRRVGRYQHKRLLALTLLAVIGNVYILMTVSLSMRANNIKTIVDTMTIQASSRHLVSHTAEKTPARPVETVKPNTKTNVQKNPISTTPVKKREKGNLTPFAVHVAFSFCRKRFENPIAETAQVSDVIDTVYDCVYRLLFYLAQIPGPLDAVSNVFPVESKLKPPNLIWPSSSAEEADDFLAQPVINVHRYGYVHNHALMCTRSKTEVLIITPSAPENFERRQRARGNPRRDFIRNASNNAKSLFFLGLPGNDTGNKTQMKINEESVKFGDIVQGNFLDVYSNIRHKTVFMLQWTTMHCSNTRFIIRNDDDIVGMNYTNIVAALSRQENNHSNFIMGYQFRYWLPVRNRCNKYYVSEEEYSDYTFPPGFAGAMWGMPIRTLELLYQATLRLKPLWLDDVYVTALCGRKVNATLIADAALEFKHVKPKKEPSSREQLPLNCVPSLPKLDLIPVGKEAELKNVADKVLSQTAVERTPEVQRSPRT